MEQYLSNRPAKQGKRLFITSVLLQLVDHGLYEEPIVEHKQRLFYNYCDTWQEAYASAVKDSLSTPRGWVVANVETIETDEFFHYTEVDLLDETVENLQKDLDTARVSSNQSHGETTEALAQIAELRAVLRYAVLQLYNSDKKHLIDNRFSPSEISDIFDEVEGTNAGDLLNRLRKAVFDTFNTPTFHEPDGMPEGQPS